MLYKTGPHSGHQMAMGLWLVGQLVKNGPAGHTPGPVITLIPISDNINRPGGPPRLESGMNKI